MEELTAKLVHTTPDGRQRFYKLNRKIKNGIYFGKHVDIPKDTAETNFKEEYKYLTDLSKDGVDVICISDAHTHIERLVFAGVEYMDKGKVCYSRYSTVIDGKNTFLIDGGSYDSVYEPCVYIRHLARLNGFKYNGIIEES